LLGVWLKKIEGQGGFEGYQFEANGRVHFINMYTIVGDKWELHAADSIRIWAYSGSIPQAQSRTFEIAELTDETLVLVPSNAVAGYRYVYHKPIIKHPADHWIGRWTTPEGRFLDLTPQGENYRLVIGALDSMGVYAGYAEDSAIRFERNGQTEYVRSRRGEFRQDQENCLIIKKGEEFCHN
jgi:hypothetical protein